MCRLIALTARSLIGRSSTLNPVGVSTDSTGVMVVCATPLSPVPPFGGFGGSGYCRCGFIGLDINHSNDQRFKNQIRIYFVIVKSFCALRSRFAHAQLQRSNSTSANRDAGSNPTAHSHEVAHERMNSAM